MFGRGFHFDGKWISNGEWFREVPIVKEHKFIEGFKAQREQATEAFVISDPIMLTFDEYSYECILFGGKAGFWPVRTELLKAVGVQLDYMNEYTFWQHPETKLILIYDPDLIGGVLPMKEAVS
jgi:hypothetical protein